jgi:DNA repair protein RecO
VATYRNTQGICLRRIDYSNTSQVAGFLTPDLGHLSVMAKGITRAPKKGIRCGLELLGRYDLTCTIRESRSLQTLTEHRLSEDFRGMRGALERILCGYYAAELALNFTAEGVPCPWLYHHVVESLRRFAEGRRLGLTALRLELDALQEHGSRPSFGACVECGRALPERGAVLFSAAAGGPLCRRCEEEQPAPAGRRATPARADLLHSLAALGAQEPEGGPELGPNQVVAMSALVRFYMRDLLGRELRMWKYLQRRKLSRSLRRLRRRAGLG